MLSGAPDGRMSSNRKSAPEESGRAINSIPRDLNLLHARHETKIAPWAHHSKSKRPSERAPRQPALVRSHPRSLMSCGLRQLVAWCVALAMVALSSQTVWAQKQADPAVIVQSQEKQSVGLAAEWLGSSDARVRAWGAYLALRDRQVNLVPQLIGLVKAYSVTGSPLTSSERDEHDAMLAVLDAIIQMQGGFPTDVAAKLYPEFPAQALISLSHDGPKAASSLLEIFKTENKLPGAWLAAGNLLMVWNPSGFAAAILANLTVHAHIAVVSENSGAGIGGGYGGSCVSGVPPVKIGWPAVGKYYVRNTTSGFTGDVLLQDGADPAFYFRTVDAAYVLRNDDESGCSKMFELNRDTVREHYLAKLAPEPSGEPFVRSYVEQTISWQDDTTYVISLRAFIGQQQRLFEALGKKLMDAGLISAEERESARPSLEVRISDFRRNSPPTLPLLQDAGSNVKIIN